MQLRLRNHAEGIAKDTMFTDIAGLDVVQGLSGCRVIRSVADLSSTSCFMGQSRLANGK